MVAIATAAAGLAAVGAFQALPKVRLTGDPKVDALILGLVGLGVILVAGKWTDGTLRLVLIGAGAGAVAYAGLQAWHSRGA